MSSYDDGSNPLAGCMFAGIAVAVVLGIILTVWVAKSHMEARSFNAVTGKNVSTWQAMWIELRVQEGGKNESR